MSIEGGPTPEYDADERFSFSKYGDAKTADQPAVYGLKYKDGTHLSCNKLEFLQTEIYMTKVRALSNPSRAVMIRVL